jgi:RNA ligase (TIGR02306 family)
MRKLASIQKVIAVEPIEGADKIEKITVLGWQLVAKRGEFAVGDLCIYFELDSVMPDTQEFCWLWSKPGEVLPRPANFRLRSKRMRGVLSQGLALPVSILPGSASAVEGEDVTAVLGVSKWEPAICSSAREIDGVFPTHLVQKTDELRVQSIPEILDELRGVDCYAAVKMDGQSLTFVKAPGSDALAVCSRNYALKDLPDSPHWQIARRLGIDSTLPAGFAIQGEFCGPGIQANRLGLKDKAFYAFQVFDISRQTYLDYADFLAFCSSRGIPTVPIEWVAPLDMDLPSLLSAADGAYESGHPREGLVIRPTSERCSKVITEYCGSNARASFKVISNAYLLKIGE